MSIAVFAGLDAVQGIFVTAMISIVKLPKFYCQAPFPYIFRLRVIFLVELARPLTYGYIVCYDGGIGKVYRPAG